VETSRRVAESPLKSRNTSVGKVVEKEMESRKKKLGRNVLIFRGEKQTRGRLSSLPDGTLKMIGQRNNLRDWAHEAEMDT